MTDFSLEYWPRRRPPIQLQTPTQVPSGTTGARGFSQAGGHKAVCWLDYTDQHPFYLVAATRQRISSAVPYTRIDIRPQYWPTTTGSILARNNLLVLESGIGN